MKEIQFKSSYNLDILSFLNVMSADEYYVNFYQSEFKCFYSLLSNEIKTEYNAFLKSIKRSNIAVALTPAVSLVEDFNNRDIKELLSAQDEIEKNLYSAGFPEILTNGIKMLPQFSGLIIQLIHELEDNGFKHYWNDKRYPLVCKRINELDGIFAKNKILMHVERYKPIQEEEVKVYVCTYANPHGTRIFRDSLIVDYIWSDKAMVNTVAHELFHPPYILENVLNEIEKLKNIDFINEAYANQNPQIAYNPIEVFIEENIVEALGTYIAFILGYEDAPYQYFKKHDGGSHVISPYLFKYLTENDIKQDQSFEEYFKEFVSRIDMI